MNLLLLISGFTLKQYKVKYYRDKDCLNFEITINIMNKGVNAPYFMKQNKNIYDTK